MPKVVIVCRCDVYEWGCMSWLACGSQRRTCRGSFSFVPFAMWVLSLSLRSLSLRGRHVLSSAELSRCLRFLLHWTYIPLGSCPVLLPFHLPMDIWVSQSFGYCEKCSCGFAYVQIFGYFLCAFRIGVAEYVIYSFEKLTNRLFVNGRHFFFSSD